MTICDLVDTDCKQYWKKRGMNYYRMILQNTKSHLIGSLDENLYLK